MLSNGRKIQTLAMLWGLLLLGVGQTCAQELWGEVRFNKSSAYLGEPIQAQVTVYTSTWFTSGLDLGNIKVNGAFTVYFRPVSKSFQKNGKTYSGVELIYHLFPYTDRNIEFPALEIAVETPAPGDYIGKKRIVKTEAHTLNIKPIPTNFKPSEWLVAPNLSVSEQWGGDKQHPKVGDVWVRTITRRAAGTVPELIPPSAWDSIPNLSIYPGQNTITSNKGKTSISAERTETVRYLFEKEGKVSIPEQVYTWYNPYQKKLYKRTLEAVTLDVAPNPDLGMLTSIRDSLQLQQQAELAANTEEEGPNLYWGLSLKQLLIRGLLILLSLFLLGKFISFLWKDYQKRRQAYRVSERYYFDQLLLSVGKGDKKSITNAFYRWVDELDLDEPTQADLWTALGVANKHSKEVGNLTQSELKALRRTFLAKKNTTNNASVDWIN